MTRHHFSIGFAVVLWILPSAVLARTDLYLEGPTDVRPGTEFPIVLKARIDQSINALKISLGYDTSRVTFLSADDRDSVVRLWLQRPSPSTSGTITMEGMVPGGVGPGFTDSIIIARFAVKTPKEGTATLNIVDPVVYLNQPDPRTDMVTVRPFSVRVRADAPEFSVRPLADDSADIDVRLLRESLIYEGAWVLVFDVRDGQETAHVRVRERRFGIWGQWHDATSPYRLSDQSLTSILEIAVADDTGEHIVRTIVPRRLMALYALASALLGVVAYRWFNSRKKRR